MLLVGLTGGIASGKSTVAGILAQAGAHIIDADVLARAVVQPGTPAYGEIRDFFGTGILKSDGMIDRAALGELVFRDTGLRRRLEAIVHPRVQQRMDDEVRRIGREFPGSVVVKDIPLLIENGPPSDLEEIIVVFVPEEIQLSRLMARDGLTEAQARFRIRSQIPMEEKRKFATILIDNRHGLEETRRNVLDVYARLVRRAA